MGVGRASSEGRKVVWSGGMGSACSRELSWEGRVRGMRTSEEVAMEPETEGWIGRGGGARS